MAQQSRVLAAYNAVITDERKQRAKRRERERKRHFIISREKKREKMFEKGQVTCLLFVWTSALKF